MTGSEGRALRAGGERYARAALSAGEMARSRPWLEVLTAVRARGEAVRVDLDARMREEVELYPRKERKRIETEWTERIRRARRRVETAALDLALQVVALWYADLACVAWGAPDLVRNADRLPALEEDSRVDPQRLRAAVEAVEDTRLRFQLNVSEELACESLAYRLERLLAAMTQPDDVALATVRRVRARSPMLARAGRVYLRVPARADRAEFISVMRASRAFHRPWATAPTDDEAFDAYLVDSRRPDFEAMLVCRREDRAILGFFNLSHITRGVAPERLPRLRRGQRVRPPGLHARGHRSRPARSLPQPPPAPDRGQHPAGQPAPRSRWPVAPASPARASPRGT